MDKDMHRGKMTGESQRGDSSKERVEDTLVYSLSMKQPLPEIHLRLLVSRDNSFRLKLSTLSI